MASAHTDRGYRPESETTAFLGAFAERSGWVKIKTGQQAKYKLWIENRTKLHDAIFPVSASCVRVLKSHTSLLLRLDPDLATA